MAGEPAEDIDVSRFNLMSFFRLFPASSCAFFRSSARLPDSFDFARLRSESLVALRRPRSSSSRPEDGEPSSSESSSESELELELLPLLSCAFLF